MVLSNRLRNMIATITVQLYDYTCLGIFERHKLMFSFQMTTMLMDGDGRLHRPSLNFFLKVRRLGKAKLQIWTNRLMHPETLLPFTTITNVLDH